MANARYVVAMRTYAFAFAVVLAPEVTQVRPNGCEPGGKLATLQVEASEGESSFEPSFDPDLTSYQAILASGSAGVMLRAYAEDPSSSVNYELVDMTNDMLVLEASLPAGGGEALLLEELVYETVSPCNAHELRVHVSCPPSEGVCVWGNYRVRIVHEDHCPQPIPCPPPTGCVP